MKLNDLKKTHPRRYGCIEFHLSDLGDRIMLGIPQNGFQNVTQFMSYEAMWNILHYLTYPIEKKIIDELKFIKEYEARKKNS